MSTKFLIFLTVVGLLYAFSITAPGITTENCEALSPSPIPAVNGMIITVKIVCVPPLVNMGNMLGYYQFGVPVALLILIGITLYIDVRYGSTNSTNQKGR